VVSWGDEPIHSCLASLATTRLRGFLIGDRPPHSILDLDRNFRLDRQLVLAGRRLASRKTTSGDMRAIMLLISSRTPLCANAPTMIDVLIGDAAHASSPIMGQGGCLAMEDAVILANALLGNSGNKWCSTAGGRKTLPAPNLTYDNVLYHILESPWPVVLFRLPSPDRRS
jgi:hypothetical protein